LSVSTKIYPCRTQNWKANRQNKRICQIFGSATQKPWTISIMPPLHSCTVAQSARRSCLPRYTPRRRYNGRVVQARVGLHSGSRHRVPKRAASREKWAMMQECAVRKLAAIADQWTILDPQWACSTNSIVIFPTPCRMCEALSYRGLGGLLTRTRHPRSHEQATSVLNRANSANLVLLLGPGEGPCGEKGVPNAVSRTL
jgi:hypothetical protein